MKKGKLLLGLKTGALALCLAASVPLSANAATVVKPDGSGIDESKMTEEEKKGYELTKKYSKTAKQKEVLRPLFLLSFRGRCEKISLQTTTKRSMFYV